MRSVDRVKSLVYFSPIMRVESKNADLDHTIASDSNKPTLQGLGAAWPICLGYFPIGAALGVLAQKAGLHPLEIGFMSLVVFAGSSQFIAISMLTAGASSVSIILTTFMVNLRHLLMSSALSVFFKKISALKLTLFAYGVTDESFAVNYSKLKNGDWDIQRSIIVNQGANIVWIVSTIAGGYAGRFIPEGAFGIDYALIAMFICLLIYQLRGKIYLITAVLAGVMSVWLSLIIPGNIYIVAASVFAATLGVLIKRKTMTRDARRGQKKQ
jgi:4-azaleucine resistance transporter AzlC